MSQSSIVQSRTDLLLKIAESISGEVGSDFLKALVTALKDTMDVSVALITVGEGQPSKRARAIYALKNGEPAQDIAYDLAGTPCAVVYTGQRVLVPCDLALQFPSEGGFSSFVGVPLLAENGEVSGHLAVFSEQPIDDPAFAESLVRIFGQRVEAERRQVEAARLREKLIEDLQLGSLKLRRRYQSLRVANAFKTRLLGMIAHDLRNPLAAITTQAELIEALLAEEPPRVDRALKGCRRIVENTERMGARIRSTLEEVKTETAALKVMPTVVDLGQVISTAVEVNRAAANRKKIELVEAEPISARCFGNEDLLLDAVDNLVSNAVKYSNSGSKVEINCSIDGAVICIAVRDEGQGLTQEDMARAFQPFQQLSATPTGGESSVGLGLANVKDIAEAHGGRVWAHSEGRNLGATFCLEVPAYRD